jgi:hypothetical protein
LHYIGCVDSRLHCAATTHDYNVFSFHPDNSPCHGFEEVLACYRKIVPHLKLSGDDERELDAFVYINCAHLF